MFLPSLEELYLDNNRLTATSPNVFIPQLKVVNFDHNRLQHFSPIWNVLRNSAHCEEIMYKNNLLSFLPTTIVEMY